MDSTIRPEVAAAALALRRSHPHVPALDVLDLVMRDKTGSVRDFGDAIVPPAPFALLLVDAFDKCMTQEEWRRFLGPAADPQLVAALRQLWATVILPRFVGRFVLTL